ncbi:fimbrial protein [Bacteroides sp.]|uniref:fimbrial protein n=1 Tax=Bacteroides sp. TaxID=29523 RepID=UPI002A82B762|nr:fimbrial protein [Bacteroides sp.]
MIKKLIKRFIPACFLFLGVFTSCTSENEPDSPASMSGISLRLQTSAGSTRSSVDTGTDLENQIHNIHLWFFASGASNTDKALFYTSELPTSAGSELVLNYTDEVLRLHNMNSEGSYELLVVANLPTDATTIGEATTLDDLKKYVYSAASSGRPHNPYTMTGSTTGAHDFSIDSQVSISLLRVASRLDVKIINATGKTLQVDKVSIVNDQQSVQLFAPASGAAAPASNPFTAAADIYTTSITADKVECSGYVYENRSTTSTDVVIEGSVDGIAKTWTAKLLPEGSATLPRNTICEVTLNLKESAIIDIEYTILDLWTDKNLASMNGETYLELDHKVLQISSTLNGLLHVSTNAATIQVDMTNADGFFLDGYTGNNIEITPTNGITELIFREDASLSILPTSGTVTITAGGITKKISLLHIESAAKFKIKSISVNGHIITEGTVLPPTFGLPSSTLSSNIAIITDNNIAWQWRLVQYVGTDESNRDNLLQDTDWKHVSYDGIAGEHTQSDLELQTNDPYFNDIITCRLEIGIYGRNVGYKILEYNFTISK